MIFTYVYIYSFICIICNICIPMYTYIYIYMYYSIIDIICNIPYLPYIYI